MGDVASTWAGWAVSAVTSKFYKSQKSAAVTEGASQTNPANAGSIVQQISSPAAESNADGVHSSDNELNWDSNSWGDMNVRKF
jgi:hypothetical protein